MTALRVGFAQREITPPLGLPLGGYAARVGGAEGVLDPLFCRAAVFEAGGTSVGVIGLDLIHVFGEWVSTVRARAAQTLGLAADHVLIAATHTHAGPGVFRSTVARHEAIVSFEHALADSVLGCLRAAISVAAAARLRFGTAPCAGVAANRRNPSLAVDDTVRVLCASDPGGRLLGVIANFACHPTVLSAANHLYSGDLFGLAAAHATQVLGAPVLLTNGAAGDVSTRFTRRDSTYAEVQRMGRHLAEALCAAVRRASPAPLPITNAPLATARQTLAVRWRALPRPDVAAARLQEALDGLGHLRGEGADPGALRLAQTRVEGAQVEWFVSSGGGWEALFGPRQPVAEVQAVRCGDVAVIAAPGELFSSAGRWLQSCLGERTLVVGYANDYLGYFVPEADARAGGYEALIAMVDPNCEPTVRSGLLSVARAAGCEPRSERGRGFEGLHIESEGS